MSVFRMIFAAAIALSTSPAYSQSLPTEALAAAGGHAGGNGGAGVVIDGTNLIATIGSLPEMKIKPLKLAEIPGLKELQDEIGLLQIPQADVNEMRLASLPTVERKYYAVDEDAVSPEVRAQIRAAYQEVLTKEGIPPEQQDIRVVALTVGKKTLLLPEFFNTCPEPYVPGGGCLKMRDKISQSSILFHESLWVKFPPANGLPTLEEYSKIIHTDEAFERWLRGTDRLTIYSRLAKIYNDESIVLRAYALVDLEAKLFGNEVDSDGTVSASFLFGDSIYLDMNREPHLDATKVEANAIARASTYSDSYFFQFIAKNPELSMSVEFWAGMDRAKCEAAVAAFQFRLPLVPNERVSWRVPVPSGGPHCELGLGFVGYKYPGIYDPYFNLIDLSQ